MTVNKLTVGLNMPEALKSIGEGKDEQAHPLPPYHARKAFLVDEYPACPKDWLRSSGRIKSYFVPIREGAGLWLDFNQCLAGTPHHAAIVVSAQGVNAITGLPCKDPQLEQYRDECPKHKKAFGPDRLCSDCGFKWPKQNYLTSAAQPNGHLWLDGFRAEDGFIRQYVFTASKMRGVANAIIGEDRVFALGISYFLSKEKRPEPQSSPLRGHTLGFCSMSPEPDHDTQAYFLNSAEMDMTAHVKSSDIKYSCNVSGLAGTTGEPGPAGAAGAPGATYNSSSAGGTLKYRSASGLIGAKGLMSRKAAFPTVSTRVIDNSVLLSAPAAPSAPIAINNVQVKKLEIAAGARVSQHIFDDPNSLDFYQGEPEGLIVINYCTEEDAIKIIEAGRVDLSGNREGFLAKIPVGQK